MRHAGVRHDGGRRDEERGLRLRELDARRHEEAGLQDALGVQDDPLDDERARLGPQGRPDVADDGVERAVRERLDEDTALLPDLDVRDRDLGDRELGAQRVDLHEPADRLTPSSRTRRRRSSSPSRRRRTGRGSCSPESLLRERERRLREVEVRALPLVLGFRDDLLLAQLGVALDLGRRPREVRAGLVELGLRLALVERGEDRRPSRRTSRARPGPSRPGRRARRPRPRTRRRRERP